jgi:hypothetical protein
VIGYDIEVQRLAHLCDDLLVALRRHVRVGPSVHGDIVAQIKLLSEGVEIVSDVAPNHEVGDLLIIRFQEFDQFVRPLSEIQHQLGKQTKTLTASGPSSKLRARVPFGLSHTSPSILHWYVEEQISGLLGSAPGATINIDRMMRKSSNRQDKRDCHRP